MSQLPISKRKFLTFPECKQHFELSKILRKMYTAWAVERHSYWDAYLEYYSYVSIEKPPPPESLKELADLYHQHIRSAQIHLKEDHLLPQISKGDKSEGMPYLPVRIFLDNLRSAHNVGSIARTTEAFRLGEIYCGGSTPALEDTKVQRTSMGTSDLIKFHHKTHLKDISGPIIALETSPAAISIHEMIFPGTFTLVVGNEEYGISDENLKQADFLVQIPLVGCKNSLNVANAFAIAAAEISRQLRNQS